MSEVKEKLEEYINTGEEISFLVNEYEQYSDWAYKVRLFLNLKFNNEEIGNFGNITLQRIGYKIDLIQKLSFLKSIQENLSYLEKNTATEKKSSNTNTKSNKIFIVHGRDDDAIKSVDNFLLKLGLKPIILKNQASKGKTIIEKLEYYADVNFAVVLLTPDDEGRLKYEKDWEDRARQNVIFEWGYCLGKLGREKVCALYTEGVKKPSDTDGLVHIMNENWKTELARELIEAGIKFNEKELLEAVQ